MHRITTLPNGVTVITDAMPHMASVSVGLWVGVGGRHEPPEWNGVSHFIEHMLFKGTRRRTASEISQAVEGIGGYLNAFTSEENSCFYAKARHDRFEELLEVLADMFLHSRFDPADVRKERAVIKEELAMYLDQPAQQVQEILNATLWPNQPLGRPLTGTSKTLDGLGRNTLLAFKRRCYVGDALVIAAAGNLDHRQVVRAARRLAGRFPAGQRPAFPPVVERQTGPRLALHSRATEQTQLALGIRTCSRHDDRRHALRLLNTVLGENMSSRLFQVIREDLGLAYNVYSLTSHFDDTGDLVISAGLDTGNLPRVLRLIGRELRRFRDRAPSLAEVRRARDYVAGQVDMGFENTESRMMWLGEQWLNYRKISPPAELKRRLEALTPSALRAAARDFFRPDRYNLALVSPLKRTTGLERALMG